MATFFEEKRRKKIQKKMVSALLPTCDTLGFGLLSARVGLTPCTIDVISITMTSIFLVVGFYSIHQTKKYYDYVYPNFNVLFRTKLILSFITIIIEIGLLLLLLLNTSLRHEFVSILSLISSSTRIVSWILQTVLMYVLHWRALQTSWVSFVF